MLDVRTPEEYEAGHVAGIRSAPGGQLVQETDNYLATWGARVVLADTDGVRAVMTASWLKQMGWSDVAVIRLEDVPGSRVTGPHRPLALGLERAQVAAISPIELKRRLEAGTVTLIDLEYSKLYRNGHIPGAWFATRTRLGVALEKLPPAASIVVTSPDGDLAHIAAAELARTTAPPVYRTRRRNTFLELRLAILSRRRLIEWPKRRTMSGCRPASAAATARAPCAPTSPGKLTS